MNSDITERLKELSAYEEQLLQLGRDLMPHGTSLYHLDLLAATTINRSLQLLDGFCMMIGRQNFMCAAPLIRLQVDTCLRFYAAQLVADNIKFVEDIIKGVRVSEQKDKTGAKMTDAYLLKQMIKNHPATLPIKDLYEATSGYIHLSEKHMFNTIQPDATAPIGGGLDITIGKIDRFIDDQTYLEAIAAFKLSLDILRELLGGWINAKVTASNSTRSAASTPVSSVNPALSTNPIVPNSANSQMITVQLGNNSSNRNTRKKPNNRKRKK